MGKIAISEKILNKPGKLTEEEYEIMKTHSAIGADIVSRLEPYQEEPLVKFAYDICRWHHERWERKGVSGRFERRGNSAPCSVVAIADVYDAAYQ